MIGTVEFAFAVVGMASTAVTVLAFLVVVIGEWRYARHTKPVIEREPVMTVYPGGRTATITRLPNHRSRA